MSNGRPQHIAVLGGLGYLGLHLTQFFLPKHRLSLIDLDATQAKTFHALTHDSCSRIMPQLYTGMRSPIDFNSGLSDSPIDCLIFAAAITDLKETQRYLDWAQAQGVRQIIFFSSAAIYGSQTLPVAEDAVVHQLLSPYAKLKRAEEECLRAWSENSNIPVLCLRLFNVYGCTLRQLVCSQTAKTLLDHLLQMAQTSVNDPIRVSFHPTPDHSMERDYIHISDVMHACEAAMNQLETLPPFTVLNVGSGQATSLNQLLNMVQAITQHRYQRLDEPAPAWETSCAVAQTQRSKQFLAWQAKVSLLNGLTQHWHTYYAR